jgi:hypothetical protein
MVAEVAGKAAALVDSLHVHPAHAQTSKYDKCHYAFLFTTFAHTPPIVQAENCKKNRLEFFTVTTSVLGPDSLHPAYPTEQNRYRSRYETKFFLELTKSDSIIYR